MKSRPPSALRRSTRERFQMKSLPRLHVLPFISAVLGAGREFYPQMCRHTLIGYRLYDYYDRIRRPHVHNTSIAAALRD